MAFLESHLVALILFSLFRRHRPEVIREAKLLLELYRDKVGLPLDLWELDLGADRTSATGTTFPKEIQVAIQRECSAVLLGALGDPRVPNLEHARDILFGMRFGYDLYANIRPVKALADRLVPLKGRTAKDVDFVVFRENTEGIYAGMGGQFKRGTPTRSRSTRTSTPARASSGSSAPPSNTPGTRPQAPDHGRQVERHAPRARALAARVQRGRGPSTPRSSHATSTSTRCASTWCRIRRSSTSSSRTTCSATS
jgi:hypothetical protein